MSNQAKRVAAVGIHREGGEDPLAVYPDAVVVLSVQYDDGSYREVGRELMSDNFSTWWRVDRERPEITEAEYRPVYNFISCFAALRPVARALQAIGYDADSFDDTWNPNAHVEVTLMAKECKAILELEARFGPKLDGKGGKP